MAARKTQRSKRKAKEKMANTPQDQIHFEHPEEFVQMMLGALKGNKWCEMMEADGLLGQIRAKTELANYLETLKLEALHYLDRLGVSKGEDEAVNALLGVATRGNIAAQRHLGVMYLTRAKVESRYERLRDYYDRDKLDSFIQKSFVADLEAMFWFKQAAQQGCTESAIMVGLMYDAARGVVNVEAIKFMVGLMFDAASSVFRNHAEAVKWIQKADVKGSAFAYTWLQDYESPTYRHS